MSIVLELVVSLPLTLNWYLPARWQIFLSVIRQKKGEPKTVVTRKQSTPNFPKNEHFLPHNTYTYVWASGGKKF